MDTVTKTTVLQWFGEMWGEVLKDCPSMRGDVIAKRQAWNDYTDALCKDRVITNYQYNTWSNPF